MYNKKNNSDLIPDNVKRMKERENETNPKFVNYNGRKRR